MPVTSISYQPATGQLIAAYRPIVFKVQATATGGGVLPPFVICDIYIADVYYKSVIRTAAESIASTYSIFQFDISDALQEYLQADLATISNNNLLQAIHTSAGVFCRFRSSDLDADGFTVEEPTAPIQGTKNVAPVAGTGTQSNSFFAINSALQHEDNQNLALHLAAYKTGTWAPNAFPLTHRNRYYFCDNDSDHYPLIFTGPCVNADIKLHYRLKGQTSFTVATAQDINICPGITFTNSVTGNRVDVALDNPIPSGQYVVTQYKKQADSVWITAGTYTAQNFFFNVNGSDIAGDYDIRVITFCTPCLSSDPETGTFTLSGAVINLAWRGINPFCVVQTFGSPIYVKMEVRDVTIDTVDLPDNINPTQRTITHSGNLYAMFFSDYNLLNPLTVNQNGLRIYVFRDRFYSFVGAVSFENQQQTVDTYIVDVNGTEVLLGEASTQIEIFTYNPYPTVDGSTNITHQYYPYPNRLLTGGNTGEKGFNTLQEYNTDTNIPTGVTKPNDIGDPDYEAPTPDTATCPNGPDISSVTFGYGLYIFNVNMHASPIIDFFTHEHLPAIDWNTGIYADTSSGGYSLVYPLVKNRNWAINILAKTLDSGNTTGYIKCRVTYIDSGGATQTAEFNVPNNVYTSLPQLFKNIVNINLSNY
jgi:hypothetical protein